MGERIAGGGRIGGVGVDEDDRAQALDEVMFKLWGDVNGELNRAQAERFIGVGLGCVGHGDRVVGAGLEGGDNGPGYRAPISVDDGGGKVFGVAVDGVPEQDKLCHRNAGEHRKGQAVPCHLGELLEDDGHQSAPAESWGFRVHEEWVVVFLLTAAKLSSLCDMR